MANWESYLNDFECMGLQDLDAQNFSDRRDTKSIFSSAIVPKLIHNLTALYKILEVDGIRIFHYESLYLDTPDLKFYNDHQRNRAKRHKIRFRRYVNQGSHYFEIKTKNGKGRSSKMRIPTNSDFNLLTSALKDIVRVHAGTDPDSLSPSLQVAVNRITLLHKDGSEKVTLDFNVQFSSGDKIKKLNDLVIAEVKQIKFNSNSDFFKIQKQLGIYPLSISKYCVGVASLNNTVKTNRFKSSLIKIQKITN